MRRACLGGVYFRPQKNTPRMEDACEAQCEARMEMYKVKPSMASVKASIERENSAQAAATLQFKACVERFRLEHETAEERAEREDIEREERECEARAEAAYARAAELERARAAELERARAAAACAATPCLCERKRKRTPEPELKEALLERVRKHLEKFEDTVADSMHKFELRASVCELQSSISRLVTAYTYNHLDRREKYAIV